MPSIEAFELYLMENGIAPKTIESYLGDVKGFTSFETLVLLERISRRIYLPQRGVGMVEAVVDYVKQNQANLIKDVIFIFISYFFTVMLSPKPNQTMYQTNVPLSNMDIINRLKNKRKEKIVT